MNKQIEGWLFDVYATSGGMVVWLLDGEGRAHQLRDSLTTSFFAWGERDELHALCEHIRAARLPAQMKRAERYDVFQRATLELLEIVVSDPARVPNIVKTVTQFNPNLTYYNCDISPAQLYFYERNVFPLAPVRVEVNEQNQICAMNAHESPWELNYALPPFKVMTLKLEGDLLNPNHGVRAPLEVGLDDSTRVLVDDDPREMLLRFQELLVEYDPDIIVSAWGDSFILPRLIELARKYRVPLSLNRDAARAIQFRPARSYFSYGRIVYKTASHVLCGRWHIDRENAFLIDDYGLDGTFELARITQVPVQHVARTSTGSGISAMEIATAYRNGWLIPWQKREPEAWKTADELIVSDKGGLVFQPVVGLHEEVAELDFVSMFPTIMEKFNVSPETVNCPCCGDARVPELGYSICRKRRGLIPETLAPLIEKRVRYKQLARELAKNDPLRETYKRRVSAHKWLLVTCFGYLGYKNARFGKIEAHEAVNAYGRDALLIAKEIAELRGFRMLHAIVDSLWIHKARASDEDYAEITRAISDATRLPIQLEGIYNWIAFLPSRQDPQMPVANRYFGVFRDGEIKMRGIEARRSDTPPFLRRAQVEMIGVLATAKNRAEFLERARDVLRMTLDLLDKLHAGQIPFRDLVISQHLSRDPKAYKTNHLNAVVAKELLGRGVQLAAGETIRYVITEYRARAPSDRARAVEHLDGLYGYDAARYAELTARTVTTLFSALGVKQSALQKRLDLTRHLLPARPRPALPSPQMELPLFATFATQTQQTQQTHRMNRARVFA